MPGCIEWLKAVTERRIGNETTGKMPRAASAVARDQVYLYRTVRHIAELFSTMPVPVIHCDPCVRNFMSAAMTRRIIMKIVVWKSPKLLSGILRIIFGIQKEEVH